MAAVDAALDVAAAPEDPAAALPDGAGAGAGADAAVDPAEAAGAASAGGVMAPDEP